jgi:hypothetical protein
MNTPVYPITNFSGESNIKLGDEVSEQRVTLYPNIELACRAISAMVGYFEYQTGAPQR